VRENRTHGSEGGEAGAFPTPIGERWLCHDSSTYSAAGPCGGERLLCRDTMGRPDAELQRRFAPHRWGARIAVWVEICGAHGSCIRRPVMMAEAELRRVVQSPRLLASSNRRAMAAAAALLALTRKSLTTSLPIVASNSMSN
jgi:hypothetical protein